MSSSTHRLRDEPLDCASGGRRPLRLKNWKLTTRQPNGTPRSAAIWFWSEIQSLAHTNFERLQDENSPSIPIGFGRYCLNGFDCSARAEIEIELQNDFIDHYMDRATIDVNYVVDKAHPRPNTAKKDGDMHVAGRAEEVKLPCVAEIMNAKDERDAVDVVHDVEGTGKTVPLSGAWRVWCEHGGNSRQVQGEHLEPFDTTNPPHVFEIHPITKLKNLSLLDSLREIKGYEPKEAHAAFVVYENLPCEIERHGDDTTIRTRMAGYNYVEFAVRLSSDDEKADDGGRLVMGQVCDLDGELLVRNSGWFSSKTANPRSRRGIGWAS